MSRKETELELERVRAFGLESEKVLTNDAYIFATTAVKGRVYSELETVNVIGDNKAALDLVRSLQNLTKIQNEIEQIMKEGKQAERSLFDRLKNPNRYKTV